MHIDHTAGIDGPVELQMPAVWRVSGTGDEPVEVDFDIVEQKPCASVRYGSYKGRRRLQAGKLEHPGRSTAKYGDCWLIRGPDKGIY
jgi:hypothetical protein